MQKQQEPRHTVLLCSIGGFYLAAVATRLWQASLGVPGTYPLWWLVLSIAIIVLYGALTLTLILLRSKDRRIGIFTAVGMMVTCTSLLGWLAPNLEPRWLYWILALIRNAIVLGNFALIIHMAALIPKRNPALVRWPHFLHFHYFFAGFLVLSTFVLQKGWLEPHLYWRPEWFFLGQDTTYLYAGLVSLTLLGYAGYHGKTDSGKRQAWIVFCGLLPWTFWRVIYLFFSTEVPATGMVRFVDLIFALLVPISFFVAIFGFRLFNVERLARKSLIYAVTIVVPVGLVSAAAVGAGLLTGYSVGFTTLPWSTAVFLILLGALLPTLWYPVTAIVDRLFFPEKLALRRLGRSIIPELAGFTDLIELSSHLVHRLQDALALKTAALLLADESREFFRVRAVSGHFSRPESCQVVISREEFAQCEPLLKGKLLSSDVARKLAKSPSSFGTSLELLEAHLIIPIRFRDQLTALLVLGAGAAGEGFDREELEHLEVLAQAVSAMLENARLFELATRDPLTGLVRRQVFNESLEAELARSRRMNRPFAVGMIDVDNFKQLNDTLGHLAGDRVLRAVANTLTSHCRKTDVTCRFGGEEFSFLLPETNREGALAFAETLRKAVSANAMETAGNAAPSVTISIGLNAVDPEQLYDSPEEILRRADEALYRAKRAGKNRVAIWERPGVSSAAAATG